MSTLGNKGTKLVALPDGSVTTDKLADDAVTTVKIQDGAVTINKLDPGISFNSTGSDIYLATNFGGF